jgi:DNA-binding response OmpR family regulator
MEESIFASAVRDYPLLAAAGLTLDPDTREVRRDGQKLYLEFREFQLLEYLICCATRTASCRGRRSSV